MGKKSEIAAFIKRSKTVSVNWMLQVESSGDVGLLVSMFSKSAFESTLHTSKMAKSYLEPMELFFFF